MVEIVDTAPTTFNQEWRLAYDYATMEAGRRPAPNNIVLTFHVHGDLDYDVLTDSLRTIASAHYALRTSFDANRDSYLQIVSSEIDLDLTIADVRSRGGLQSIMSAARDIANSGFDTRIPPLWRTCIWRLGASEYVIMFVFDHYVMDGWSTQVFMRDLAGAYREKVSATGLKRNEARRYQLTDHARGERSLVRSARLRADEEPWREWFSGIVVPPLFPLPATAPCHEPSHVGQTITATLGDLAVGILRREARKSGATLAMVVLASFKSALRDIGAADDIAVLMPVANRPADAEESLGWFANLSVVRSDLEGSRLPGDVLDRVRDAVFRALEWGWLPLPAVRRAFSPSDHHIGASYPFGLYNFTRDLPWEVEGFTSSGLDLSPIVLEPDTSRQACSLWATDHGDTLDLTLRYDPALYTRSTMQRLSESIIGVLAHWPDPERANASTR